MFIKPFKAELCGLRLSESLSIPFSGYKTLTFHSHQLCHTEASHTLFISSKVTAFQGPEREKSVTKRMETHTLYYVRKYGLGGLYPSEVTKKLNHM